jgi:hypothetical protein
MAAHFAAHGPRLPDNVVPQYGERGPSLDVTTFTSAIQH